MTKRTGSGLSRPYLRSTFLSVSGLRLLALDGWNGLAGVRFIMMNVISAIAKIVGMNHMMRLRMNPTIAISVLSHPAGRETRPARSAPDPEHEPTPLPAGF